MKLAITSQGTELSSPVDPRFGRAKHFIIAEADSGDFEAVDNTQNLNAPQGAGIQAAQNVANRGVKAVLTGHMGPNAFRTLSVAGIKVFAGVDGTVAEALEKFKAGGFQESKAADVEGHWV